MKKKTTIKIKLKSVYCESLFLYLKYLKVFFNTLNIKSSLFILPLQFKRMTLLKSPHVNKKAKEQFEVRYYQVIIILKQPFSLKFLQYLIINKPKSIQIKIKL